MKTTDLRSADGSLARPSPLYTRLLFACLVAVVFACGSCHTGQPVTANSAGQNAGTGPQGPLPQYDTLSVRYMRSMGDGKSSEVGRLERPVADFRDKPVSLVVRQTAGEKDADPSHFDARFEIGADRQALPALDLDGSKPATCTAREWLEFELRGPAGANRKVVRELFSRTDDRPRAPTYRRYTLVSVPGAITAAEVDQRIKRTVPDLKVDDRKAKAKEIEEEARKAGPEQAGALVARLDNLDAGGPLMHLLALGFAAESDRLTDTLAADTGVTVQRNVPRILVVTTQTEADAEKASVSLDLRLDEVGATSADPSQALLFQFSRGMDESSLEGAYLRAMTGEEAAVSTAFLMEQAARSEVETVVLDAGSREEAASLGLPADVAALVNAALDQGHQVFIPRQAVDLAGKSRWGFWDVDPETGRTIGVMEGGQHQGIVEIPMTTNTVPLNPQMAFFLGMELGAISTAWGMSGLILTYGEITKELVNQLIAMIKNLACMSCPTIQKKTYDPTNTAKECADLVKKMVGKALKKKGKNGEKEGGDSFCDMYQEGFMCGASMMLGSLRPPKREGDPKYVKTWTIGCSEEKLPDYTPPTPKGTGGKGGGKGKKK